jgi:hypothetical protein
LEVRKRTDLKRSRERSGSTWKRQDFTISRLTLRNGRTLKITMRSTIGIMGNTGRKTDLTKIGQDFQIFIATISHPKLKSSCKGTRSEDSNDSNNF